MGNEPEICIAFTVPHLIPPSNNHYKEPCRYTGRDGFSHLGFKVTKEAKAFYNAVAIFARGRTVIPQTNPRKARYGVKIDVYLGARQRGDFDNFFKCGLDALVRCGMITTDAAVSGEHSQCVIHKDDRQNPRTTYLVTLLEQEG